MRLLDYLLGKPIASGDEDEQKIGPAVGVAVLGLDGLGSAAYGPEAALTLLLPLGTLGLAYSIPITGVILALLAILYFSYRQTIAAYPNGGGSYTVARENLGTKAGLLAAAALMLDYLLNVTVGISAGMGALVSAFPGLHPHLLTLCLVTLLLLTFVNLRGVRESGVALGLPTAVFVSTLFLVIGIGLYKTLVSGGHPTAVVAPPALPAATEAVTLWLLLRAFASGCTAMTGVEAVSNGVGAFAKPAVANAQKTLTAIAVILAVLLAGNAFLSRAYSIGATNPEGQGYQSVLSQLVGAVVGRGVLYYITIGSVLAVLALSANTSFAGFPRLCHQIAHDGFLPHAFMIRGRRLVYSIGLILLAILSGLLLVAFGGVTDRLIPLFAVGAFLAFTLSQAGMVVHWYKQGGSVASRAVNLVGCITTGIALVIVLAAKFRDGAWITLVVLPALYFVFTWIRKHYDYVEQATKPESLSTGALTALLEPPVVVVPMREWNCVTERALLFALTISSEVVVTYVRNEDEDDGTFITHWETKVVPAMKAAGRDVPRLQVLPSPFRQLFRPLIREIDTLKEEYPTRQVAVIIPELVESRWYEYLLHNQRATFLKAELLLKGDNRVVVINVPWYLGHARCSAGPTE